MNFGIHRRNVNKAKYVTSDRLWIHETLQWAVEEHRYFEWIQNSRFLSAFKLGVRARKPFGSHQ